MFNTPMRQRKHFYGTHNEVISLKTRSPVSKDLGGLSTLTPRTAYLLLVIIKTPWYSSELLSNMMNNKRITKAVAILLGTAAIVKIAYYEAEMVSVVHVCLLIRQGV